MKTQLVEKVPEQGQVFHDIVTTQVNICWLPDTDTFSPSLHMATSLAKLVRTYVFVYSKTTLMW